jgi:hypothetical protein
MTRRAALGICALLLCSAPAAHAADPGRWVLTSISSVSGDYRQGLASDRAGNVFFSGPFDGVHRTRNLVETAKNNAVIPPDVQQREQYNHVGDIAWDGDGARLLLPLESYSPFAQDQNPSKTGSIGVVSPATLKWSYYVKLDPTEIQKAQWVATAADGLLWTIAGADLLAYNLSDVNPGNAAPDGSVLHSFQRLAGVVPGGAGGGAELDGRLYMSTSGGGADRVVSVDLNTGVSRVEYERPGTLEAEGVDVGPYLGGLLHVEYVSGLSNGQVMNFLPKGTPLRLKLGHARVRAGKRTIVTVRVFADTGVFHIPLAGVQVRIGRAAARTNAAGRARVVVELTRGAYRAHASFKGLRTAAAKLRAT